MQFCIILGAMKAGTTSLFNYLSQHPNIAPCKQKEPSFFSHHYDKGDEYYLNLWEKEDINNKILLEASVNYTKHPSFPKSSQNLLDFINKYNADAKFIYIMRDPIDRLVSQYTYSYARWTNDTLEKRLKHGHIVKVSLYAHQLNQYYSKFPHENFLLLDFDDLKKQPHNVLKKICDFLCIDQNFVFNDLTKKHNVSQGRTISRPLDRILKKYPKLKSIINIFPKSLRHFLFRLFFRKKINQHFELTENQREYVNQLLEKDMAQLRNKYNVDVEKWGF